jgi:hypothetical protein
MFLPKGFPTPTRIQQIMVHSDITGFQRYRRPDGESAEENHNPDPGLNTRETNIEKHRAMVPPHSLAAEEPSEALNVMEVSDKEFRDNMPNASVATEGGGTVGFQAKRDRHMAEDPEAYSGQVYAPPTSVNPGTAGTGPKDEEEGKKQADEGYERELQAAYAPDLQAGASETSKQLSQERLAQGGKPLAPAGGEGDGGDFVELKSGDAVPLTKAEELPEGSALGDDSAPAPEQPLPEPPQVEPAEEAPPPEQPPANPVPIPPVVNPPEGSPEIIPGQPAGQPQEQPPEQPPEQTQEQEPTPEAGPEEEPVSKFETMTKAELVAYARDTHGTILENSMKKDAMIETIEKMESGV